MIQRAFAQREAAGELPWVCNCWVIGHSAVSILLEKKTSGGIIFWIKARPHADMNFILLERRHQADPGGWGRVCSAREAGH